jgi:hypothetical protein
MNKRKSCCFQNAHPMGVEIDARYGTRSRVPLARTARNQDTERRAARRDSAERQPLSETHPVIICCVRTTACLAPIGRARCRDP